MRPRMGIDVALFLSPPAEDLICPICTDVLESPVSACGEGHSFCDDCLRKCVCRTDSPKCPTCRAEVPKGQPMVKNILVKNLIGAMPVRCPHGIPAEGGAPKRQRCETTSTASGGERCAWTGKHSELATHLKTCSFVEVGCPHEACAERLQRRHLDDHVRVCDYRPVCCEDCGATIPACSRRQHGDRCPKKIVSCSGCGANVQRERLARHRAFFCPKQPVACPYAHQGCKARPERAKLQEHMLEALVQHAELVNKRVSALEGRCESLKEAHDELSTAHGELKEAHGELREVHDGLSAEHDELKEAHEDLQREHTELKEWESVDLTWDVKNWAETEQDGETIFSHSVPVAGFAMRLSLHFEGKGSSRHIGFFIGHCGGLTWAPIRIGGSSITLRSTKADKTVTKNFGSCDEIEESMASFGFVKFAKVADIKKKTWGLCVDDALKVSATIRVQRVNAGRLSL